MRIPFISFVRRGTAVSASVVILSLVLACEKDSTIGPSDNISTYTTLTVNLSGMTPHIGQLMSFDIRTNSNALVGRAILDPLTAASESFKMPGAIPPGASDSLCFFADVNANRVYDPPPTDYAWRVAVPSNGTVNFSANTSYDDIGTVSGLLNLDMNFDSSFNSHAAGKLVEIRVADSLTGQTVGLYRKVPFGSGVQQIIISGVLRTNSAYRVDLYADQDGNAHYDPPPTDHAWRLYGRTTNLPLIVNFFPTTNYTDVKF